MNTHFTALSLVLGAALLGACGSSAAPPQDGGATDGGVAPADGGSAGGTVTLGLLGGRPPQSLIVSARRGADAQRACTNRMTMGACTYEECPTTEDSRPRVAIGTVTFSSGGTTAMVAPNAMGEYPLGESMFAAGSMVMVQVPGGNGAPAFSGTVRIPTGNPEFTITSPPEGPVTIMRSGDFVVDWRGENFGTTSVTLVRGTGGITCRVPSGDGRVVLPAALLGLLQPGDSSLVVTQATEETRTEGGWRFSLGAGAGLGGRSVTIR